MPYFLIFMVAFLPLFVITAHVVNVRWRRNWERKNGDLNSVLDQLSETDEVDSTAGGRAHRL